MAENSKTGELAGVHNPQKIRKDGGTRKGKTASSQGDSMKDEKKRGAEQTDGQSSAKHDITSPPRAQAVSEGAQERQRSTGPQAEGLSSSNTASSNNALLVQSDPRKENDGGAFNSQVFKAVSVTAFLSETVAQVLPGDALNKMQDTHGIRVSKNAKVPYLQGGYHQIKKAEKTLLEWLPQHAQAIDTRSQSSEQPAGNSAYPKSQSSVQFGRKSTEFSSQSTVQHNGRNSGPGSHASVQRDKKNDDSREMSSLQQDGTNPDPRSEQHSEKNAEPLVQRSGRKADSRSQQSGQGGGETADPNLQVPAQLGEKNTGPKSQSSVQHGGKNADSRSQSSVQQGGKNADPRSQSSAQQGGKNADTRSQSSVQQGGKNADPRSQSSVQQSGNADPRSQSLVQQGGKNPDPRSQSSVQLGGKNADPRSQSSVQQGGKNADPRSQSSAQQGGKSSDTRSQSSVQQGGKNADPRSQSSVQQSENADPRSQSLVQQGGKNPDPRSQSSVQLGGKNADPRSQSSVQQSGNADPRSQSSVQQGGKNADQRSQSSVQHGWKNADPRSQSSVQQGGNADPKSHLPVQANSAVSGGNNADTTLQSSKQHNRKNVVLGSVPSGQRDGESSDLRLQSLEQQYGNNADSRSQSSRRRNGENAESKAQSPVQCNGKMADLRSLSSEQHNGRNADPRPQSSLQQDGKRVDASAQQNGKSSPSSKQPSGKNADPRSQSSEQHKEKNADPTSKSSAQNGGRSADPKPQSSVQHNGKNASPRPRSSAQSVEKSAGKGSHLSNESHMSSSSSDAPSTSPSNTARKPRHNYPLASNTETHRAKTPPKAPPGTDVEVTYRARQSNILVQVYCADITKLKVGGIVSAANSKLKLKVGRGGGVSGAIAKAAGDELKKDCEKWIKKHGQLKVAHTVSTRAGRLTCQSVIHALGPRWDHYTDVSTCLSDLHSTFINCLWAAEETKLSSVAIPAISSGSFGVPQNYVTQKLYEACRAFCGDQHKKSHLRCIHLVDFNEEHVKQLRILFGGDTKVFEVLPTANSTMENQTGVRRKETGQKHGACTQKAQSSGGANIGPGNGYKMRNSAPTKINRESRNETSSSRCGTSSEAWAGTQKTNVRPTSKDNGSLNASATAGKCRNGQKADDDDEQCPICFEVPTAKEKTQLPCQHIFCRACKDQAFALKPVCPVCGAIYGVLSGTQPDGEMKVEYDKSIILPGFQRKTGTITITYTFRDGSQQDHHPSPGRPYRGTTRTAFLPDNSEGRHVLDLLRQAFDARLIFTIGTSTTTGRSGQVTWNDIHHKTSIYGGPASFGYPDPTYLTRVKDELAAKGIK